jgi:heme/copper-type cytochrome/quinol oxidase subunit 2
MSSHEKHAWASLLAAILVWLYLSMRMTAGWAMAEVTVRHMVWTYIAVIILLIVAHALIAAALAARDGGEAFKDERDRAIEARAERVEGYVVLAAINIVVIHALAHAAYAGHVLPRIELTSLPTLVFVLLSTLFAGHAAKQLAVIWLYRT